MIPKNIHYIWLGGEENIPENQKEFIQGWKEKLKDYHFYFWNEQTYRKCFGANDFVDFCIQKKKYAFAADLIRLQVLFTYGGIYLDTDVKVLKDFSPFLKDKAFLSFHFDVSLGTAVIGCEPSLPSIFDLIQLTQKMMNGSFVVNNDLFTNYFLENSNLLLNGKEQYLNNGWHILPRFYFEKSTAWYRGFTGGYARHYPAGSWCDQKRGKSFLRDFSRILIGEAATDDLYNWYIVRKSPLYERYRKDRKK